MSTTHASRDLTRRRFLRRASRLATGGLAAVAAMNGSFARDARAESQRPRIGRRTERVAVVGADHYHATSTPNYLRILQGERTLRGPDHPDTLAASNNLAVAYRLSG